MKLEFLWALLEIQIFGMKCKAHGAQDCMNNMLYAQQTRKLLRKNEMC